VKNFRNITQPPEANGLVIHVSSLNDRSTEVVMGEHVRIGTTDDCDVKIRLPHISSGPANGAAIEVTRVNGTYRFDKIDPALDVKLNGRPIKSNKVIQDGDEIWIGPAGPSVHFFPITSTAALVPGRKGSTHVAPFIEQAAMEASATARRDDAKIFLREFTRELVREINPSTKIIIFAIIIFAVAGALYIGYAQFNEARRNRRVIADQQERLIAQQKELQRANEQLTQVIESNNQVIKTISLGEVLRVNYGTGVCLIAGSYMFVEQGTGRPLRYPETQTNESGETIQSGNESPTLTPEGRGTIAEYPFVGTGFNVGNGYVLTNRHVVQPWFADERTQSLSSTVNGRPKLKKLTAFFPGHPQPITLKYKQASSGEDVAVCTLDLKELPPKTPVLPLDVGSDSVAVGRLVVTMGYPSGPDRLLAMLEPGEAQGIQNRYGSTDALLNYLAQTKNIQPLTTQGNITDLNGQRIVYDARTGEGGSGGPLFGPSGRVIGITYAIFTENAASNFAVPIRFGIGLLEKTGWTAPPSPEADQKDTANTGQTNQR
jgi:S1-C subfamily serine protease